MNFRCFLLRNCFYCVCWIIKFINRVLLLFVFSISSSSWVIIKRVINIRFLAMRLSFVERRNCLVKLVGMLYIYNCFCSRRSISTSLCVSLFLNFLSFLFVSWGYKIVDRQIFFSCTCMNWTWIIFCRFKALATSEDIK